MILYSHKVLVEGLTAGLWPTGAEAALVQEHHENLSACSISSPLEILCFIYCIKQNMDDSLETKAFPILSFVLFHAVHFQN